MELLREDRMTPTLVLVAVVAGWVALSLTWKVTRKLAKVGLTIVLVVATVSMVQHHPDTVRHGADVARSGYVTLKHLVE
jgi:hypothetical protein